MARLGVRREPTAPSFHVASRRLPPCVGPAEHSPMVVPHLPVIRAAAPPGILNAPLPTAAPGPHSAPRNGTPVPIPTFCPGPSPQLPPDRAPRPSSVPIFAFLPGGLGPHPAPQLPRDRAPCLTSPHRRPSFSQANLLRGQVPWKHKSSRQHHGQGCQARSAPVPSSVRAIACAS